MTKTQLKMNTRNAAVVLGKLGGHARARSTTSAQRKAWARKAGQASGRARSKARNESPQNGTKEKNERNATIGI